MQDQQSRTIPKRINARWIAVIFIVIGLMAFAWVIIHKVKENMSVTKREWIVSESIEQKNRIPYLSQVALAIARREQVPRDNQKSLFQLGITEWNVVKTNENRGGVQFDFGGADGHFGLFFETPISESEREKTLTLIYPTFNARHPSVWFYSDR